MNYKFTVHCSTSCSTTSSRPKNRKSAHRSGLGDFANPRNQIARPVQFRPAEPFLRSLCCIYRENTLVAKVLSASLERSNQLMTQITNKATPMLHERHQPPLSHPGATPDSDRAKKPPLAEPPGTDSELSPGDRVEGLGNFGVPTGQLGTVERTNEEDAVVKWDGGGRMRLRQPWLKKV